MKRITYYYLCAALTFAPGTVRSDPPVISVQTKVIEGVTYLQILAPGPRKVKVTSLDTPPRVVAELPSEGAETSVGPVPDSPHVKGIRVGAEKGTTKIVIDLKGPPQYEHSTVGEKTFIVFGSR